MSTMSVILPDPGPLGAGVIPQIRQIQYPTLYLLHGLSDDHSAWQRPTAFERYVQGLNLAVVMPCADRCYFTDMVTGKRYWTYFSEEVPAIARHFFPLSEDRSENYVAGLSMGDYGAFKLALTNPASLSAAVDVAYLAQAEKSAGQYELEQIFW